LLKLFEYQNFQDDYINISIFKVCQVLLTHIDAGRRIFLTFSNTQTSRFIQSIAANFSTFTSGNEQNARIHIVSSLICNTM